MTSYQSPADLLLAQRMVALAPKEAKAFLAFDHAAKSLGTTQEELAEIVLIAAAVRAGATVGHGLLALRLFDQAPAV